MTELTVLMASLQNLLRAIRAGHKYVVKLTPGMSVRGVNPIYFLSCFRVQLCDRPSLTPRYFHLQEFGETISFFFSPGKCQRVSGKARTYLLLKQERKKQSCHFSRLRINALETIQCACVKRERERERERATIVSVSSEAARSFAHQSG